jgi:hypothetical protein
LRLISTSFVIASPLEKFEFFMSLLLRSTLTSSPRDYRRPSSPSLGPVLMFAVLPVPTAGEC